jgi:hypothetical protein
MNTHDGDRTRVTPGAFPYRQTPHRYCGSNSERQQVGDPGHCEDCCSVGHIVAHPECGCADVGCYSDHKAPAHRRPDLELDEAAQAALHALNATVAELGRCWYAQRPMTGGQVGVLAELRFQLLSDDAARDAGLLD